MLCPDTDNRVDYYSQKQQYTINTHGVVGPNLIFLDVATFYPGSIHDVQVLRSTSLLSMAERR